MFRGAFQFGEGGERIARLLRLSVSDLQQDGLVRLDDQRSVSQGHGQSPLGVLIATWPFYAELRRMVQVVTEATRCGWMRSDSPPDSVTPTIATGLIVTTEIHSRTAEPEALT